MYAHSYIWAKILLTLTEHFPEDKVDQWLENAEIIECSEDHLIMYTPSHENLQCLRENCRPYILDLLKALLQCNATIELWGTEELEQYRRKQASQPDYFKPLYQFQNFVVGSSNEMAYKLAKAVAENPGKHSYNPLYIYGPRGVDKTHLLCSIANEIHLARPEAQICYVLADAFVSELIWGIQSGRLEGFRQKYRSADVLIIEDVQFLAGKASVQEGFYHIFDHLYQNNKQIIMSANSYPARIPKLEYYLSSKFEQGITVCIEAPDLNIRHTIISLLGQKYKLDLNSETIRYLTDSITDSVRSIEGALKKLRAAHDLAGVDLSIDNVKSILLQADK